MMPITLPESIIVSLPLFCEIIVWGAEVCRYQLRRVDQADGKIRHSERSV